MTAPSDPDPVPSHDEDNQEVVLRLGDILARIPTHALKPGEHDRMLPIRFSVDELSGKIARGRVSVPLSRLASACPQVFERPESAEADTEIPLPLQKLLLQIRPLPSPGMGVPGSSTQALSQPAAEQTQTSSDPGAESSQGSPVASAKPAAPGGAAANPSDPVPEGTAEEPPGPPRLVKALFSARGLFSFFAKPPPDSLPEPLAPPAQGVESTEPPNPPAAPPAHASEGTTVAQPDTPGPAPSNPGGNTPPSTANTAPSAESGSARPAGAATPPPSREAPAPPEQATEVQASPPVPENFISLRVLSIYQFLPSSVLRPGPLPPPATRLHVPLGLIESQLAGGHVELPVETIIEALPADLRSRFQQTSGVNVWIPLDEIFQNLPPTHLFYIPPFEASAAPELSEPVSAVSGVKMDVSSQTPAPEGAGSDSHAREAGQPVTTSRDAPPAPPEKPRVQSPEDASMGTELSADAPPVGPSTPGDLPPAPVIDIAPQEPPPKIPQKAPQEPDPELNPPAESKTAQSKGEMAEHAKPAPSGLIGNPSGSSVPASSPSPSAAPQAEDEPRRDPAGPPLAPSSTSEPPEKPASPLPAALDPPTPVSAPAPPEALLPPPPGESLQLTSLPPATDQASQPVEEQAGGPAQDPQPPTSHAPPPPPEGEQPAQSSVEEKSQGNISPELPATEAASARPSPPAPAPGVAREAVDVPSSSGQSTTPLPSPAGSPAESKGRTPKLPATGPSSSPAAGRPAPAAPSPAQLAAPKPLSEADAQIETKLLAEARLLAETETAVSTSPEGAHGSSSPAATPPPSEPGPANAEQAAAPWMRGFRTPPPPLLSPSAHSGAGQAPSETPEGTRSEPLPHPLTSEARQSAASLAAQPGIFAAAAFVEGAIFASPDFPRKPDLDTLREVVGAFIGCARENALRLGWQRILTLACEDFFVTAIVRDAHFLVALHKEHALAPAAHQALIAAAEALTKASVPPAPATPLP